MEWASAPPNFSLKGSIDMLIDNLLTLSLSQAITTTAVSTNVIDIGVGRDLGIGDNPTLDINAQVVVAFTGGTSIQASWQGSTDNSTFVDMAFGPVVALANLVVGAQLLPFPVPMMQPGLTSMYRYYRVNYVVVGTMTAGAVTTTLILDRQASRAYAPGLVIAN